MSGALLPESSLKEIHKALGHPEAASLSYFVQSKILRIPWTTFAKFFRNAMTVQN